MKTAIVLGLGLLAACDKAGSSGTSGSGASDKGAVAARDPLLAVALPAGAVRTTGKNFHVDAAALGPCAAGAPCVVAADLTAENGFKVNPEYPYKLVEPSVALAGAATFTPLSTHHGRLLVKFDRAAAGPSQLTGTFKLSVCSADVCQIEQVALAVALP